LKPPLTVTGNNHLKPVALKCTLYLVDPSFDQGQISKYRLSILVTPDGFSFSVLDTRTRIFLALGCYEISSDSFTGSHAHHLLCDSITRELENNELLGLTYGRIDLVYASPKVTLVPPGFVHGNNYEEYFRFNHILDPSELIHHEEIPVGSVQAVFAYPACLEDVMQRKFSKAKPGSSAAALIQGLLKDNAHILKRQVFINIWRHSFDIVIIQGTHLQYYNTFQRQTPEDLLYYVIFVLEQLGFIPAEEEVLLMGEISPDDADYKLLYQYVKYLEFVNLNSLADFSPVFSGVLVHQFYTLFNLPFCE